MRPKPADRADDLAAFVLSFPSWTGGDGLPLSWRHYVVGLRHLARRDARDRLRTATAVRAAQGDRDGFREFVTRLERIAD
ncbi:MAG: hypothetical protein ACODAE_09260 [Gemmatimonadota bacterium]